MGGFQTASYLSDLLDVDARVAGIGFSLLTVAITVAAMLAITSGEIVGIPTLCGTGGAILCDSARPATSSRWSRKARGFSVKRRDIRASLASSSYARARPVFPITKFSS